MNEAVNSSGKTSGTKHNVKCLRDLEKCASLGFYYRTATSKNMLHHKKEMSCLCQIVDVMAPMSNTRPQN